MKLYSVQELYHLLKPSDENVWIEAKGQSDSSKSLMESVCSFSNEPGLSGGYILGGELVKLKNQKKTDLWLKGWMILIKRGLIFLLNAPVCLIFRFDLELM